MINKYIKGFIGNLLNIINKYNNYKLDEFIELIRLCFKVYLEACF